MSSKYISLAKVLHNYEAKGETDLTILKGQTVKVIDKKYEANGWWIGENESGKMGLFPLSYVSEVPNSSPQVDESKNQPKSGSSSSLPVQAGKKFKFKFSFSNIFIFPLILRVKNEYND